MLTSGVFGYLTDYLLFWALFASLVIHAWCFFRCFPREKRPRAALVLGNGLVLVCMIGAIALAGETYLRFVSIETDAFGMSLPARRWFAIYGAQNSVGFRDAEWAPGDRPGVRRIAFVGDSFTYGWGIEERADRFPDRIQARFDAATPGTVEVMNVAKPGWGTASEIPAVDGMIERYGVDEVVLCYVPNDIEKLLPRSPDFDPIRPPEPGWINLSTSCLMDYLYCRVWVPRVPTVFRYHDWLADGFADSAIWQAHRRQLTELIEVCRERGVTIRVALLPFIRTSGEKFQAAKLQAMLSDFFSEHGVPVVDLLPAIANEAPGRLVVNGHDAHPNQRAHELFADAIWAAFYAH